MPIHKLDNYLRSHRRRLDLSQDDVAYLLGSNSGTKVSRYERGIRSVSLETALAYEAIYGVPISAAFEGRFQKIRQTVKRRSRLLAKKLQDNPATSLLSKKRETLAAITARV